MFSFYDVICYNNSSEIDGIIGNCNSQILLKAVHVTVAEGHIMRASLAAEIRVKVH